MAEDLRINIIADASQAERALKSVEAGAKQATQAMTGLASSVTSAANATASATKAMAANLNAVTTSANKAAVAVSTLEDKIARAKRIQGLTNSPSPFPAATGRGYTSAFGGAGNFSSIANSAIGSLGAIYGPGALAYGAVSAVRSYTDSVADVYSPEARGLANQGPFAAAKTLGVDATKAFRDYAESLHKTADALTIAEQKQAVFNAAQGRGAKIAAESAQFRSSTAGYFETLQDYAGRGFKGIGQYIAESYRTGAGVAPLSPRAYREISNTFQGGDYAQPVTGYDPGYGVFGIQKLLGGLISGGGSAISGAIRYFGEEQRARLEGFHLSAFNAYGDAQLHAQDVEDINNQTYGNRRAQLRAGIQSGDQALVAGLGGLTSLEARLGGLKQTQSIGGGYGIRTGIYGQVTDQAFGFDVSTKYGETQKETLDRIFGNADKYADKFRRDGIPEAEVSKIRAAYLVQATAGIDPSAFTDAQRSTVQSAIEQSIQDQLAEIAKQSILQARMDANLTAIRNKFVGAAEFDPEKDKMTSVIVKDETGPLSSVRFSDDQRNSAFTTNGDSFSNVDGF